MREESDKEMEVVEDEGMRNRPRRRRGMRRGIKRGKRNENESIDAGLRRDERPGADGLVFLEILALWHFQNKASPRQTQ